MKIANIYPVKAQAMYRGEECVMILAHLVKKGLYTPDVFTNKNQFIIMDNGLFEGEQVDTDVNTCIELAQQSGIDVDEIIVPDAVNDMRTTKELFEQNLFTMRRYKDDFRFMVVAQAKNYQELQEIICFYNRYEGVLPLTVGISKLAEWDRGSEEAIRIYKSCLLPIHFLGIKKSFAELFGVSDIIRSCDTSQLAFIDKNTDKIPDRILTYVREGKDIDLEHDDCNIPRLMCLRSLFQAEGKLSGILQ